jgi:hypothetical protein
MSVSPARSAVGRSRTVRVGMALASWTLVAIGPLATAVLAATPDHPPSTDPIPAEISPFTLILTTALQAAPLVALILAVLFRARLRTADGRRIGAVLAIRVLPLAGLATFALGVAAVPVCARFDNSSLLPGLECMIPGVVLGVMGVTSFILHAPLARIFAGRPAVAAWLAVGLSVPAIVGYTTLESVLSAVSV